MKLAKSRQFKSAARVVRGLCFDVLEREGQMVCGQGEPVEIILERPAWSEVKETLASLLHKQDAPRDA